MNYKITIIRKEPNPNYAAEVAKFDERNRFHNYSDRPQIEKDIITDALICELTDEQFKKIKLECFKSFE